MDVAVVYEISLQIDSDAGSGETETVMSIIPIGQKDRQGTGFFELT
jgi:hypothetical protein